MIDRPPEIQARHLEKWAVVYARQSSPEQVRDNTGSTQVQLQLRELPLRWGWPAPRIKVLDDFGRSGSIPGLRPKFRELCGLIEEDKVSLLLLHDWSRASRNTREGEELLELIVTYGLLVWESGRLYDGASDDLAEHFGFKVRNVLTWWEQANRTRTFRLGKQGRIKQGFTVSRPPFGFVVLVRGKWALHPDPDVRSAMRRPFDLYFKFNSVQRVIRYYDSHGLLHPYQVAGKIVWRPISAFELLRILRNPNYTPDYVYGRTFSRPSRGSAKRRVKKRPRSAWQIIPNHHEGYVTREKWDAIQAMLDRNHKSNRPPILDGPALLQGLIWCGRCDRRIKTVPDRRVRSLHLCSYQCRFLLPDKKTLHRCFREPSERLDAVVVPSILQALSPPTFEEARTVLNTHAAELADTDLAKRVQLQRVEKEALEYKTRYLAVDPSNLEVKAELEAEWQRAIRDRDRLRAASSDGESTVRPWRPEDVEELFALAGQLDTLWHAPTTTNKDRKEILAAVISRIVIKEVTDEWLDLEVVWKGGFSETHRVIRSKGIASAVKDLRNAGVTDSQAAELLRARGVLGRAGGAVSRNVITKRVQRLGLQHEALWKEGLLQIRELVDQGRSAPEILEEFRANGPRHWRNNWTLRIVEDWIRRLRKGKRLHGVPPLPPDPKSAHRSETPPEVIAVMERRRKERRSWRAIADELHAEGYRPARAERFTPVRCTTLYAMWRRRGKLRELAPDGRSRRLRHSERRSV
jgi:DNA invertase Pin-like site-specific DNA recombinase